MVCDRKSLVDFQWRRNTLSYPASAKQGPCSEYRILLTPRMCSCSMCSFETWPAWFCPCHKRFPPESLSFVDSSRLMEVDKDLYAVCLHLALRKGLSSPLYQGHSIPTMVGLEAGLSPIAFVRTSWMSPSPLFCRSRPIQKSRRKASKKGPRESRTPVLNQSEENICGRRRIEAIRAICRWIQARRGRLPTNEHIGCKRIVPTPLQRPSNVCDPWEASSCLS